jgi:SAM-dependent methyltransferase
VTEERNRLRATFDEAALLYHEARPGYPAALFDDVMALSDIPPRGRILEIGCGTGQATLPFARRGYRILCIELGGHLAALARRNLAAFPLVEVRRGAFEAWPLEEGAFDLAIAASAFHWLDPAIAYSRTVRALQPEGALALWWNAHVRSEGDQGFFEAVQKVYQRDAPELARSYHPLPAPDAVPDWTAEIKQTGLFGPMAVRQYRWDACYDASSYVRLLSTYSDHLALTSDARERLFAGITELIDTRFGGRIAKGYLTVLYVARRKLA